jgi:phosphatidylserine decarboxylase
LALSIVREGTPYIISPAILALLAAVLGFWYVFSFFLVIALFMAFFFRNPERTPPSDSDVVVAPADGRVTRIKPVTNDDLNSETLVSIFLSPLDVHINRSPIAGTISAMSYKPGRFLMATNEKASQENEQNVLTLEGEQITVVCKQIAGILARRVVCWKKKGDNLALGERFGMIKFSSRTDLVLPPNVKVVVSEGDRVQGGTTVIGKIG